MVGNVLAPDAGSKRPPMNSCVSVIFAVLSCSVLVAMGDLRIVSAGVGVLVRNNRGMGVSRVSNLPIRKTMIADGGGCTSP